MARVRSDSTSARYLYVECRVGDPSFDNSNFVATWQDLNRQRHGVVEEDDYDALRHSIWLATDGAYKRALEQLARKEAYIQAHPQKEAIPDFSEENFIRVPKTVLRLDSIPAGDPNSESTWSVRAEKLLDRFGPFRLAFLETVLRVADWRATRKEQECRDRDCGENSPPSV